MSKIQHAPWISAIDLPFFATLGSLKIDKDRLDDSARKVLGLYQLRPDDPAENTPRMGIHDTALTTDDVPAEHLRGEGWIKNFNTAEEFKNCNRQKILDLAGRNIWDAIRDETIYSCPSLLSSFYVISYADLKKYRFTYHFAYPVLHSDPSWTLVPGASPEKLSPAATTLLVDTYRTWRYTVDSRQHGFFLLKRVPLEPKKGKGKAKATRSDHGPGFSDEEELDFTFVVGSIASFKSGFFDGIKKEDRFVAFVDPSTYPSSPAWMLRNYLVLMRQAWELTEVQVLCYRDIHSRRERPTSIILRMQTTPGPVLKQLPKLTGWERYNNKLTHRVADLGSIMDPLRLADQSVDLNLKLIKWRIAPSLDLDVIKQTSCLLLGAGTLGSNVARYLMGWGVRKITFVDNSTVSFSNPVRQSLFRYKDSLNGGVKKALRAAEALEEIYPGVVTRGELLSVPMVGHAILDEAKTKEEFDKLRDLIYEHDVVFLLFDSRESRWLPTLMAKAAGKLVLNAALGFESFVVMRQGLKPNEEGDVELGCYFCNDVFAPGNSLKDATLDQQCTVTRPGIAPIASALLVELLVSILQHPRKGRAPAPPVGPPPGVTGGSHPADTSCTEKSDFVHPLGLVPHQLRGFLSSFHTMHVVGQPYPQCSACSDAVVRAYDRDGWAFVRRALAEKGFVEEVSGLAEVQRRAEELDADLDWEGEEDGDGELL